MSSEILQSFSLDHLLLECSDASALPATDLDGTVALLDEAKRRSEVGELHSSQFDVIKAALEPCRTYSAMQIGSFALMPTHHWHGKRRALREMAGERPLSFLYHGTLRSRLLGISREGLIPAKRSKKWGTPGVTEHAGTGVFFEGNWRKASHWVGAAAYDENGKPVKGAIVRIPVSNLVVEADIRSQGSLVVRRDRIPVDEAEVLLFPLTVTGKWTPLLAAVEVVRRTRKSNPRS